MGLTKTELFTEEQNRIAGIAKCFAHPARIAIIQHLLNQNSCINSDLVTELGLAQATISQHLKELKTCGLISGTIEGASMNYCINSAIWNQFKNQFNALFEQMNDNCSDECF